MREDETQRTVSPATGSVRKLTARAAAPAPVTARPPAAAIRARRHARRRYPHRLRRRPDASDTPYPQAWLQQHFAKPLEIINLTALNKFEDGDIVTAEALLAKGILSKCEYGYKVLGNGNVTKKVTVQAAAFSQSAKDAIEAAGGKAEVI